MSTNILHAVFASHLMQEEEVVGTDMSGAEGETGIETTAGGEVTVESGIEGRAFIASYSSVSYLSTHILTLSSPWYPFFSMHCFYFISF